MSQTEHMQEFMTRPGKGLFQESGQLKRPYSYKSEQNIHRTSVPLKKLYMSTVLVLLALLTVSSYYWAEWCPYGMDL